MARCGPYTDVDHGVVKSAKEAQVDLVERIGDDGRSCLIAERRAIERMSTYGKKLLQDRWTGTEHEVMSKLWHAGVSVPYPIAFVDDVFDLEYVGSWEMAAAQLSAARLTPSQLADAFEQLLVGLRAITATGFAHGDLSAYNLLWWEERLWFIDFPQSIDIAADLPGFDFLHCDVLNVVDWFERRGLDVDAEEGFADLLSFL